MTKQQLHATPIGAEVKTTRLIRIQVNDGLRAIPIGDLCKLLDKGPGRAKIEALEHPTPNVVGWVDADAIERVVNGR